MNEAAPRMDADRGSHAESRASRRFRGVPLRLLIPNLITLLALCLGLTAIRFALEGSIEWAVSAIAAAAVLDGLDGRIARALKGTSRFGAELDSLADFVDFGVAPAIVLYVSGLHEMKALGWLAALVFAIACALRLARFNVMIDDPDSRPGARHFFVGMPAPAGAVVGLLPVYLHLSLVSSVPDVARSGAGRERSMSSASRCLMASRVPHFSGKSIGRVPREYVAVVLFALAAALLLIANFPLRDAGGAVAALSRLHPVQHPAFPRLRRENG